MEIEQKEIYKIEKKGKDNLQAIKGHKSFSSYINSRIKKASGQDLDFILWTQVKRAFEHFEEKEHKIENIIDIGNIQRGFDKRFKTTEEKVTCILRNNKELIGKSKNIPHFYFNLVQYYYVKDNCIEWIVPMRKFNKIVSPETITRACRKLFEKAEKGDDNLRFLLKNPALLQQKDLEEENYNHHFKKQGGNK